MSSHTIQWLHQWPPTGSAAVRLGRAGDDLVAEWPSFGTLRSDAAGTRSQFTPGLNAPLHVQERLGRGRRCAPSAPPGCYHLACFERQLGGRRRGLPGRESGAGKSTLAAKLCTVVPSALLSDDATALRFEGPRIEVDPTEGHHWLRPDMARALGIDPGGHLKVPLEASRHGRGPVALGAIVSLTFDETISAPILRRLHGVPAFIALSLSTFRFALDVPDVLQRELDNLARIAREVPVYELCRRREPAAMEASYPIVRLLLEELGKGRHGA